MYVYIIYKWTEEAFGQNILKLMLFLLNTIYIWYAILDRNQPVEITIVYFVLSQFVIITPFCKKVP